MEELVNKLADLQEALDNAATSTAADPLIIEYKAAIVELEKQVSDKRDALYDLESTGRQEDIKRLIEETKAEIIDEWDEEKKTYKFDGKTLSFTRTGSLKIKDGVRLMELLIEKAPMVDVVGKYIRGFKLTYVKKFVEVNNVQTGVASMAYKTTVRLKTE